MTDDVTRLRTDIAYWRQSHQAQMDAGLRNVLAAAERDLLKQGPTIWRSSQVPNWPMQKAGAKKLQELMRDLLMLNGGKIEFSVPLADVAQEIWLEMEKAR